MLSACLSREGSDQSRPEPGVEVVGEGSQEPEPVQPLCAVVAGPSLVEGPELPRGVGL